jgi:hypothetical protein
MPDRCILCGEPLAPRSGPLRAVLDRFRPPPPTNCRDREACLARRYVQRYGQRWAHIDGHWVRED